MLLVIARGARMVKIYITPRRGIFGDWARGRKFDHVLIYPPHVPNLRLHYSRPSRLPSSCNLILAPSSTNLGMHNLAVVGVHASRQGWTLFVPHMCLSGQRWRSCCRSMTLNRPSDSLEKPNLARARRVSRSAREVILFPLKSPFVVCLLYSSWRSKIRSMADITGTW
jgi:hypothetical protein